MNEDQVLVDQIFALALPKADGPISVERWTAMWTAGWTTAASPRGELAEKNRQTSEEVAALLRHFGLT
jgi:hypothetical protein